MRKRQWIATWHTPDSKLHTYVFESIDSRGIAGIDFRLALLAQGRKVPQTYVLDELDRRVQIQERPKA